MTAIAQRPQIEVYSKPAVHGTRDESELEKLLEATERATSLHKIADIEELKLTSEAVTRRDGYRYTSHSFRQLCQIVAPGLSTLLPDISGMARKDIPEEEIDGVKALQVFNSLLELRFQRLSAFRVIRNEDERLIEGVVGTKHRSLENLTLLRQARDSIASGAAHPHSFHAGVLIGRRMMLWYRNPAPVLSVSVEGIPWPIYSGYYFCNGEATGTSVRATMALFTSHGTALAPINKFGGRVTHIGRDFNRRLDKLFGALLSKEVPREKLVKGSQRLFAESLGYEDLDDRRRKSRSKAIIKALGEAGIQQRLAADILDEALERGYRGAAARPSYQTDKVYASRRLFDLFCSVVRTARQLPINRREKTEQAAYTLLTQGLKP